MENAEKEYKACCEAVRVLLKKHDEIIDGSVNSANSFKKGIARGLKSQDVKNLMAYILLSDAGFYGDVSLSDMGMQRLFGGGVLLHQEGVTLVSPHPENTEDNS